MGGFRKAVGTSAGDMVSHTPTQLFSVSVRLFTGRARQASKLDMTGRNARELRHVLCGRALQNEGHPISAAVVDVGKVVEVAGTFVAWPEMRRPAAVKHTCGFTQRSLKSIPRVDCRQ